MCPWAAARPLAVRAASLRLGASARSPARPCRRPRTPRPRPPVPSAPAALCRCVWWPGPATAHGHRDHALHTGGVVLLCVVARPCRRPRIPRSCPPGSAAPSTLRTHVVSCVAAPGGRILIRTVGIVLREVSGKASPGPLQAFWSRGGYESMSGCDRASQAHTEAPGAVAPGALAAIRCELSEPNATRSVAA